MRKSISRVDVENITDIYRCAFTTVTGIHPLMSVVEPPSTPQRPAKIFDISNDHRHAIAGNDCTAHGTIAFVGPKVLGEASFCSYLIFSRNGINFAEFSLSFIRLFAYNSGTYTSHTTRHNVSRHVTRNFSLGGGRVQV